MWGKPWRKLFPHNAPHLESPRIWARTNKLTVSLTPVAAVPDIYISILWWRASTSILLAEDQQTTLLCRSICPTRSWAVVLLCMFVCRMRILVLTFFYFLQIFFKDLVPTSPYREQEPDFLCVVRHPCKEYSIFSDSQVFASSSSSPCL